jgi:hypothetical protein
VLLLLEKEKKIQQVALIAFYLFFFLCFFFSFLFAAGNEGEWNARAELR